MNYAEQLEKMKHGNVAERAAAIGFEYGGFDGGHHKMWVIDQMLRVLCGDQYPTIVAAFEAPDEDGDEYEWDEGIAP